jgi:zinc protease
MKAIHFLTAFLCLTFFLQAQTKSQPTDRLPLDPKVRYGVLPNGLKYYIRYNAKPEKRAELRLAVNAGSTMENDDQQGLAHFVEHMAFNGSKHFKKNELVDYLEGIGTKFGPDLNAYTSFDETVYMLQIPTDKAEVYNKGLLVLEDWARYLTFDSVEVDKERGVVMEEWRLGQGAYERMSRKFWPLMFKDSRYAERFPIGKPEILKGCRQQLLKDFYNDWYRPDLQAVIVVGDINLDETEKLIKERFSKLAGPKTPRKLENWQVPDQKGLRVSVASDKESPYNVLDLSYFSAPTTMKTHGDYREHLKRSLINSMLNARLAEVTRKQTSTMLFAGAGFNSVLKNKSAYNCYAVFPNGKALDVLKAVLTENERVKRHGFVKSELERHKKQMLTQYETSYNERSKTESKSLVGELVSYFLNDAAVPGIENEFKYVKEYLPTITLEELNAMVKSWIRTEGDNAMVVFMLSENEKNALPTEAAIREAFGAAEKNTSVEPYTDNAINAPLISKRPIAQKVVASADKGYGITEWKLGNGARILIKPTTFKDDEILFNAFSWGGTAMYPEPEFPNADASNGVQEMMGFGAFDATALEKYLQDKTASLHTGVSLNSEVLAGRSSKKDLNTLLQLIYMAFTMARKDTAGFRTYIEQQRGFIQNAMADPESVFRDSVNYILSGNNLRMEPMNEEKLRSINLERAHMIYKERFTDPSDFVFVFVGNFNTDSLKPLVEQYIGGISAPKRFETLMDPGTNVPPGAFTKIFTRGTEPRSSVHMVWNGTFDYNRKNRFELRALTSLLNITLRENLREDKGGVYGVGIWPNIEKINEGRYQLHVSFACAPENVDKLMAATVEEVNKVKQSGCNDINLSKIKETFLKEREVQMKDNNFWMQYILQSDSHKENLSDLDLYTQWVNGLKGEDFKKFAAKYFLDASLKQFILNPEKKQ